jgi:hypothetical protein
MPAHPAKLSLATIPLSAPFSILVVLAALAFLLALALLSTLAFSGTWSRVLRGDCLELRQ